MKNDWKRIFAFEEREAGKQFDIDAINPSEH